MSETASVRAAKEHELRLKIPESFKDMRGSLLRLQAQVACEAYFRINLQLQIDELNSISKKQCPAWSMTKPQLTDISPAEVRQEEELEDDLAAAEEAFAVIVQQLHGMRQTLRVEANRRHNSTNLLLALPLAVLRRVIPKDAKWARLICSTLRDAYGALGTGVLLPHASRNPPSTALVNTYLRRWPLPGSVTQLRALSFLPASTCEELSATFPSLAALTAVVGMESFSAMAPAGVTRLVLASSNQRGPAGQQREDPLRGCSRHFSALRSLTLTGCTSPALLADLSPITALAQLTSLTLLSSKNCEPQAARDDCEVHREWPELGARRGQPPIAACDQSVWGVLAALPALARLHLDVRFNYHSDLPALAPLLPALTHLVVLAEKMMTLRDVRRGVQVPFVRVLDLLPALASLEVLDPSKGAEPGPPWSLAAWSHGRQLLVQDLEQRGLQELRLPTYFERF